MKNKEFIITDDTGERIDKFLNNKLELSRTYIQKLVKDGNILVNGKKVKVNYRLKLSDKVNVAIPEPEKIELKPQKMDLDIIYEDKDVIVINKPSGLVVHPAFGHKENTLVNSILAHAKDLSTINGVIRPGIVHRLDKDTSGLIMVAKNDFAHESLARQLKEKTVLRKYVALVKGVIPHNEGIIDAPIGRDPKNRKKMTVTSINSKNAITHFKVLERFSDYTLVECTLITGRTHQIRVHMKYIGHPVCDDPLYGSGKKLGNNGQLLHAKTLGFNHPKTSEYLEFTAPLPKKFSDILESLKTQ
ncbi:MAG TPA: RluA family pseudouridine synthase [Tenericutes bacterium]|nr:RluA family pseudouridine synthase [Mycoplasmatota bacterium]